MSRYEETTAYSATMAAIEEQKRFLESAHEADPVRFAAANSAHNQFMIAEAIALFTNLYAKHLAGELNERQDLLSNNHKLHQAQMQLRFDRVLRENQEELDTLNEQLDATLQDARERANYKLRAIGAPLLNEKSAESSSEDRADGDRTLEQIRAETTKLEQSEEILAAHHEEYMSTHSTIGEQLRKASEHRMCMYDEYAASVKKSSDEFVAECTLIEDEHRTICDNMVMIFDQFAKVREAYKIAFTELHIRNGVMPVVIRL
jgi:hypothetical protein